MENLTKKILSVYIMVLILDGKSKFRFVISLDLVKCLKQIKLQRLFLTFEPIFDISLSDLPSSMI